MDTWGFAKPMLIFAAIFLIAIGCLFGSCTCAIVNGAQPQFEPATDRVDLIEVNHLYDASGSHVIDQLIFWDWSQPHARFHVRAWRLIKSTGQLPQRDWNRGCFVCHWRDAATMRVVYAARTRETWTTYDPEVLEREVLPMEWRQELSRAAQSRRRIAAN